MTTTDTTNFILKTNGLVIPVSFPIAPYERIQEVVATTYAQHPLYGHYSGAWNALAYRYRATVDSGADFIKHIETHGTTPPPEERYLQERVLFDFFSSGFSVFESAFYGLYTIGAFLVPATFPLTSERDQQKVSPNRTKEAFTSAFQGDPIVVAFQELFADTEYQQWRDIRNVLTHRTAPGRRIYVSVGSDDAPPTEWKINNKPLDASIASNGIEELSRLLTHLLTMAATFVEARLR